MLEESMRKSTENRKSSQFSHHLTFLQELLQETRQQRELLDKTCSSENKLEEKNQINPNSIISSIGHHLDTRTYIVGELYDTEKSYVESLRILVEKYYNPLKNHELIDLQLIESIFYQIPSILKHHELFLDLLRNRIKNWSTNEIIGDIFINSLINDKIVENYKQFIGNWKNAKNSLKFCTKNSNFNKFLESQSREYSKKLSLDALLIMPVQRIPRYELLLKQLIKNTDESHPDWALLQKAGKYVHDLATTINYNEREYHDLKDIENLVEGYNNTNDARSFIKFEIVTIGKKERAIFLFNDILLLTSIIRKNRKISITSTMDSNKYKLLSLIPLDKIEIIVNDQKYQQFIENDLEIIQQINQLFSKLNTKNVLIEENLKEMQNNLQKQLNEFTHQSIDFNYNKYENLLFINLIIIFS